MHRTPNKLREIGARAAEGHYARLKRQQCAEGWFPEYGGADLGYSTLALDLLGCAHRNGYADASAMAKPLTQFLLSNVAENGCLPGRLGSRGTNHCFVFGAEYFASSDRNAAELAAAFREAHRGQRLHGPDRIDDRYFAYFYFPQFALAACLVNAPLPTVQNPALPSATFEKAGLRVIRIKGVSVHSSRYLGGAIAIATHRRDLFYHLGYSLQARNGKRYATAIWSEDARYDGASEYNANFHRVIDDKPLQRWSALFPLVTRLLAIPGLASLFSAMVKARMIRGRERFGGRLNRRVTIHEDAVEIQDTVMINRPEEMASLSTQIEIGVHSPSARFERLQDTSTDFGVSESDIVTLRKSGKAVLTHLIKLDDALM